MSARIDEIRNRMMWQKYTSLEPLLRSYGDVVASVRETGFERVTLDLDGTSG